VTRARSGRLPQHDLSRGTLPAPVDPLPVLLLRRGRVSLRRLGALQHDPRVELFPVAELGADAVSLAQRLAGVLVATGGEPLDALTYVVTAGISAPIVVAMTAAHKKRVADVIAAGATACLVMPVRKADVDKLVKELLTRTSSSRVDGTLRLLLDPIGRIARFQQRSIRLSQREFALLYSLSAGRGHPVPADELLRDVWGEADQTRAILDVYIFALRKKLARLGLRGAISTVRGYGYALVHVGTRSSER
jgi:DNA-binding response OmpR family regulator